MHICAFILLMWVSKMEARKSWLSQNGDILFLYLYHFSNLFDFALFFFSYVIKIVVIFLFMCFVKIVKIEYPPNRQLLNSPLIDISLFQSIWTIQFACVDCIDMYLLWCTDIEEVFIACNHISVTNTMYIYCLTFHVISCCYLYYEDCLLIGIIRMINLN